ncbi:ABC transporter ATP-binding protein [Aerococcaceae bacterium DSM 111176]|nr:ABC transporter ATP-binding protein [Aerococcaceae bacterium DSM 111176]
MQVRFENITLTFDNNKTVLDNINFTLPSSELLSFLGPSGSGKSTTLYLISGLLSPTSGKIYFDDQDVTKMDPVKREVGLVFQNYALYPHMTVRENIMFPLKMAKMNKRARIERAEEMAMLTRIQDQLDKYPRQLSGGQQQRVAISRALAKEPKILLMDEPLSNLDARLRIEMREEIRRIQQETKITTVFVTHDQEEALSIADNVMVLNDGHIQQMTDPVSLYRQPANLFVANFIGTPVINKFTRQSQSLNQQHDLMKEEWHTLGIRPEYIQHSNEADHLIQAEVKRVDIVGKDQTVHLEFQGEEIIASDLSGNLEEESLVYLTADPEGILLFDKDGKKLDKAATTDVQVGNSDDE